MMGSVPRILHVINDFRVGGAEALVRDLCARLGGEGWDVSVVALQPNPTFIEDAVRGTGGVAFTAHPAEWGFYSVRHVAALAAAMRDADLVHVHLFPAQLWAALAWRSLPHRARPKIVTTEHNTTNRRRTWWFRSADRWLYRHYRDTVVAVSPPTAAALTGWVGPGCVGDVRVIPTAIDFDRFAGAEPTPRADLPGVPTGSPLLLSVGRLEPQKDHATLLRALPLLSDIHAVLVGDGPLRGELEALAQSLRVRDRAHFLGRRPDIPRLLKAADVFVQPSRFEGWSIAILEAMASASAPIVASRAPGLAEAVTGRGWLFDVGDTEALAEAVRDALVDRDEAARRIAAGREFAEQFRIEQCVEKHRALYRELLGENAPAT